MILLSITTAEPSLTHKHSVHLPRIILASSSPRRRQLLHQIGVQFDIYPPHIEEVKSADELPVEYVQRLAREKAATIAAEYPEAIVLGSDTTVVLGNDILEKPADAEEAFAMLKRLSGNTHRVYTGFSLIQKGTGEEVTSYDTAEVTFRELDDEEIHAYIRTGSPLDKAGSYGIQDDYGAVFIERIVGDYYSVVGLPLTKVYLALRDFAMRTTPQQS